MTLTDCELMPLTSCQLALIEGEERSTAAPDAEEVSGQSDVTG